MVDTLAEAIDWAERTRRFRSEFVRRCSAGMTLAEVRAEVEEADASTPGPEVDRLGELRLLPVLEAMPAAGGKVASRRLLAGAGLAEDVELGRVDGAAWEALLAGLDSGAAIGAPT